MSVLSAWMSVHNIVCSAHRSQKSSLKSPGTAVTVGCKLLCVFWKSNPDRSSARADSTLNYWAISAGPKAFDNFCFTTLCLLRPISQSKFSLSSPSAPWRYQEHHSAQYLGK